MKYFILPLFLAFASGGIRAVNCERIVKANSTKEMKVEIIINKDDYKGFARLAELLPEGAQVKYAKTEGGTFMVQDNKLKFIWLALPKQNTITASYIISTETLRDGNYAIDGKFSYVESNETKEYDLPSSTFTIDNNLTASVKSVSPVAAESFKTTSNKVVPEKVESTSISTTDKIEKVTFALQLLSSKDKLAANYFSTKYQINDKVKVENVNGLNKYMLGEFNTIDEASSYRKKLITKGFKDAFVVAYKNDHRITIDEAQKLTEAK
ncbi:MAG: SPOR domain-containing protein [Bacteroidia bacterium]|nr:SPOR domain-containing protein [Bacteroidia bacterium]